MRHIRAPDIKLMVDALGMQDGRKAAGRIRVFPIALTRNNMNMVAAANLRKQAVVLHIGQVLYRRVEIHILIVVPFGVGAQIVVAAHTDDPAEEVRPAEEQVDRVQSPQRCAAGDDGGALTRHAFDERHDFLKDILIELLMPDRLVAGVHIGVEPALCVDAVDGKHLHFARIDRACNGINQVKALVLQVVGGSCWQKEQRKAVVPVDGNFHLFVEAGAVPGMDVSVHRWFLISRKDSGLGDK